MPYTVMEGIGLFSPHRPAAQQKTHGRLSRVNCDDTRGEVNEAFAAHLLLAVKSIQSPSR